MQLESMKEMHKEYQALENYSLACKNLSDVMKKKKTSTLFLSNYRNTRESLGKREMLREHKPQMSVSTAFSSFPKLSC